MKTIFKYSFVLLILSTFFNLNLYSQTWENLNAPYGGYVKKIVSQDTILFAVTASRLYKSSNEGMNWEEVGSKIEILGLIDLISHRNSLYATIENIGIMRSTDNGDSWDIINNGITNNYIKYIASDGDILYIQPKDGKTLISTDNGDNWIKPIVIYEEFEKISGMATFSDSVNTYLAYNIDYKFYIYSKNKNKEDLERLASGSLNVFVAGASITSIVVKDTYIFLSYVITGSKSSGGGGLIISSDYGATWSKGQSKYLFYQDVTSLTFNDNTLIASTINFNDASFTRFTQEYNFLYKSTDYGKTWDSVYLGNKIVNHLFNYKNRVYASLGYKFNGFTEGVISSIDNFSTWDIKNIGINSKSINNIYSSDSLLILEYFNHWDKVNAAFEPTMTYYKSSDLGLTWSRLDDTVFYEAYNMVIVDNEYYLNTTNGLYKSTDNLKTWNKLKSPIFTQRLFYSNGLFISGDIYSDFQYKFISKDKCLTWDTIRFSPFVGYIINKLDYANNKFYILTNTTFLQSEDNGKSWNTVKFTNTNTNTNGESLLEMCSINNSLFGNFASNISKISNDGTKWEKPLKYNPTSQYMRLFQSENILAITIPKYGSFKKNELFTSLDNGNNWKSIQNNLSSDDKTDVRVFNNKLYVSSLRTGLWSTDLAVTGVETELKKEDKLLVYPNPASAFISIDNSKTEFNSNSLVTYSITNMEGKTLSTFQKFEPMFNVNTSDIPNGTYFLRAEQDKNCYLKIITIQK